jgi:hypothetical protein
MSLASRLKRLEERIGRGAGGECPNPQIGAIIDKGQPLPPDEEVAVCENCGGRHVLEIEDVVIPSGCTQEEADAIMAQVREANEQEQENC